MIPYSQPSRLPEYSRDSLARKATVPVVERASEAVSAAFWAGPLRDVPAFEMKFLVSEEQARGIEHLAGSDFSIDPHGDPALGNGYRTTTLYSDTPSFEVHYRVPPFKRRKYRLRRYGCEPGIFLERKSRRGDRVKKRRTLIPHAELALLSNPFSTVDWIGHWFHRYVVRRQLCPVCRIAYHRVAYVGESAGGPMRLTFDRAIRGCVTNGWVVDPFEGGLPVLAGHVVCEFKFRGSMPVFFKGMVQAMRLAPIRISKYRTFMQAHLQGPHRGIIHV